MRVGRLLSTVAAAAAVAGCAVMVAKMGTSAVPGTPGSAPTTAAAAATSIPVMLSTSAGGSPSASSSAAPSATSSLSPSATGLSTSTSAAHTTAPAGTRPVLVPTSSTSADPHPTVTVVAPPPPVTGGSLPLGFSTGSATRVITVVSSAAGNTTATLQAWTKAPGGGWLPYGPAVLAHVGSQGMTSSPSEFESATPIGSFTLTQAFGYYGNPGTPLPYFQTTPADWWISQSGPYYNTHQHCSSNCPFNQGSPNEHLYYETPYYNYAVVIDTPSGASAYPHGSAFFLHVTDGTPTAGCVAIPQSNLVPIMRWLTPSAHPRILIGVT